MSLFWNKRSTCVTQLYLWSIPLNSVETIAGKSLENADIYEDLSISSIFPGQGENWKSIMK